MQVLIAMIPSGLCAQTGTGARRGEGPSGDARVQSFVIPARRTGTRLVGMALTCGRGLSGTPSGGALSAISTARANAAAPFAYVVQPGDTVYGISRKLGVPLREVIDANTLQPPYTLSVSQSLSISNPRRHVIRPGETMYGISRGYGVEMTELLRLNGIAPPYTIPPGATLVLPAARLGSASPTPPPALHAPATPHPPA